MKTFVSSVILAKQTKKIVPIGCRVEGFWSFPEQVPAMQHHRVVTVKQPL